METALGTHFTVFCGVCKTKREVPISHKHRNWLEAKLMVTQEDIFAEAQTSEEPHVLNGWYYGYLTLNNSVRLLCCGPCHKATKEMNASRPAIRRNGRSGPPTRRYYRKYRRSE